MLRNLMFFLLSGISPDTHSYSVRMVSASGRSVKNLSLSIGDSP